MSTTVDKRIVSMEFQNERFERNIKKSMQSLEEFEKKLDFKNASKSLKDFEKEVNDVDFSKMAASIDSLERRFSTLGIVGMSVIHNLTTSAMHTISGITGKIKNMIYTGGLSRAMNIEKAKFQLEGLGVAWTDIFGDIDYAVTNTAYALDSAAVAASQLVASGVEIGNDVTPYLRELGYTGEIGAEGLDSMAVSLKAISGVAAQTSSDYDSIAHIFTTVAGQGRLMTMQLRQLEMRGLNVAAKIGEVMGATEAQVREMVTKGMIDYETFAYTMFTLFADHAAEANKTLTGVTANIKAAFSRIGAEFINPIIKNEGPLVNMLEEIRKRINYIKKALTDWKRGGVLDDKVVEDTTGFLEYITDKIKHFPIQNVVVIMNMIGKVYSGISQFVKNMHPFLSAIKQDFKDILPSRHTMRDVWLFGENVKKALSNFKYISETTRELTQTFNNNEVGVAMTETFVEVNPKLEKLRRSLKGVFALFSIGKQAIEAILMPIKTFIKVFFKGDSIFLTATAGIGDFLVAVDSFIKESGIFIKVGEKLSWVVEKVVGGFVKLKDGFLNGLSIMDFRSGRMMNIGSVFAAMAPDMSLVEKLGMGISSVFGGLSNVFNFVKEKVEGVVSVFKGLNKAGAGTAELIEGLKSKKGLFQKIPYAIKIAWDFLKGKFEALKENAPNLLQKVKDGFIALKDAIDPVVSSIGEFISTLASDAVKKFIDLFSRGTTIIQNNSDKIGDGFTKVKNVLSDILKFIRDEAGKGFNGIMDTLGNFVSSGNSEKILDFIERLIKLRLEWKLGGLVTSLALFNTKLAGVMGKIGEGINRFLHPFQRQKKTKNPFKAIADIMLEVAASIAIITGSIIVIGNTPQEKLDKAIGVLIDIFAMYTLLGIALRKSGKGLNVGGKGLISMAASIFIIAMSIKHLANGVKDPNVLMQATISILGVMGVILLFINKTSKMTVGSIEEAKAFNEKTKAMNKMMSRIGRSLIWLSIGISSLWIPFKVLSSIPEDDFKRLALPVFGIIAAVVGICAIFASLSRGQAQVAKIGNINVSSVIGADTNVIKQLAKSIGLISGGLIILSAAITSFAVPLMVFSRLFETYGEDGTLGDAITFTLVIAGFVGALSIILGCIANLDKGSANKYDVKIIRRMAVSVAEISGGMIILAAALAAFSIPLKLIGEIDPNVFTQGSKFIYRILIGLGAFVAILALLTKTGTLIGEVGPWHKDVWKENTGTLGNVWKTLLALSVSMIGIAYAMKVMAGAISEIGKISKKSFDQGYTVLVTILVAFGAIIGLLAFLGGGNSKGININLSGGIKAALSKLKDGLKKAGSFAKTVTLMITTGIMVVALAGAIKIIADAMSKIANIDDKFQQAAGTVAVIFGALSALMIGLVLIGKSMHGMDLANVAGVLLSVSVGIVAIGAAINLMCQGLDGVDLPELEAIGNVMLAISVALGALTLAASFIPGVKAGLGTLALFIVSIGASLYLGAKGFETFIEGINKFGEATRKKLPIIIETIDDNIGKACLVILKSGAIIAGTIVGVIGEALAAVGLHAFEFGAAAAVIITGLLTGLESQMSLLIDGLIVFIITAVDALGSALEEHGEDVITAIGHLLMSLLAGAFNGIISLIDINGWYSAGEKAGYAFNSGFVSGTEKNKELEGWKKYKEIRDKVSRDYLAEETLWQQKYKNPVGTSATQKAILNSVRPDYNKMYEDAFSDIDDPYVLKYVDRWMTPWQVNKLDEKLEEYENYISNKADETVNTLDESGEKVEKEYPGFLNQIFGGTKLGELIENGKNNVIGMFQNLLPNFKVSSILGGEEGGSFFQNLLNNFGIAFFGTDPVKDAEEEAKSEKEKAKEAYNAMIAEFAADDSPMTYTSARVLQDIEEYKKKQERKKAEEKWRKEHPKEAAEIDQRRATKHSTLARRAEKKKEREADIAQLEADRADLAKIDSMLSDDSLPEGKIAALKAKREKLATEINELGAKTAEIVDVYIGYKEELDLLNEKIQNGDGLALAVDGGGTHTISEAEENKDKPLSAAAQKIVDDGNKAKEILSKYADNPLVGEAVKIITGVEEDTKEATKSATKSLDDLEHVTSRTSEVTKSITDHVKQIKDVMDDSKQHFGNWAAAGKNFALDPIDDAVNDSHKWNGIITSFKAYNDLLRDQPRIAFDMHSPSKEMEKDGENVILGWIRGINLTKGLGVTATKNVFEKIHEAASAVIDKLNTLVEGGDDFSPKITPVLDLSKVNSQGAKISSALGSDYTIHIASDIDRAVREIQNGRREIINAINGISTRLNQLPHVTNNYTVEEVTYDEGSSVASAVETLTVEALKLRRA